MEITVAQERAFRFKEALTFEEAEARAWTNRWETFGALAKVSSLLQRSRDDDFVLEYKEHRLVPFWHVSCVAQSKYVRHRSVAIPIDSRIVTRATIEDRELDVRNGQAHLTVAEHCEECHEEEVFVDGLTAQHSERLKEYFGHDRTVIAADALQALGHTVVVVPPKARASTVVHDLLKRTMRSPEADQIVEDRLTVRNLDLYYRPVYAFQFQWRSRHKEGVLEVDGLTGEMRGSGEVFREYVGKVLDPDFLFDLGLDTVGLLVPGSGLAVKIAKKGLQVARSSQS